MGGHTTGKLGKQCEYFWQREKIFSQNSHPEIPHRPKDKGKIIFECPEWGTIHTHRAAEEKKKQVSNSHTGELRSEGKKEWYMRSEYNSGHTETFRKRKIHFEHACTCMFMHVHLCMHVMYSWNISGGGKSFFTKQSPRNSTPPK